MSDQFTRVEIPLPVQLFRSLDQSARTNGVKLDAEIKTRLKTSLESEQRLSFVSRHCVRIFGLCLDDELLQIIRAEAKRLNCSNSNVILSRLSNDFPKPVRPKRISTYVPKRPRNSDSCAAHG